MTVGQLRELREAVGGHAEFLARPLDPLLDVVARPVMGVVGNVALFADAIECVKGRLERVGDFSIRTRRQRRQSRRWGI